MQRPKIKIKSEFKPNRLIYLAEMPRLNEGELESVKAKKEEEGPELDINGLVSQSNRIIDGHAAQLEELPAEYNQRLHDEIVRYFLASPGRFEQDQKKGLNTAEFNAYRAEMVSKVRTIMAENAPTEEDIRAVRETREGAESAEKASENVKPLEVKEVTEDPGQINNLPELDQKFSVYNGWNASLQQEAANVMQTSQSFQQEYARYNTARKGVRAYKQFMAYLYPEEDQQRIEMQRKLNESKAKVAAAIQKYEATKDKISKYGEALGQVSNRLKQEKMAERDERMRRFASMSNQTEEEKRQKEEQYKLLESRQREMQTERDNLNTYKENISQNRETYASRVDVAKNKQEQLTEFNGALNSAITRVEEALQNRNLSEQARSDLEQTRDQLLSKKNEAGAGLNAAQTIAEGGSEKVVQLEGAEKEAAERSLNLETHLSQQVEPAIAGLDVSIANLETEKLEFATTTEQINSYYEQAFKNYDAVDEAVDSAVLNNNLATDRVLAALKSQQAALNNVDLAPPGGVTGAFEATVGVPLSMLGGAINMAGEGLLDQATWLSDTLERARPEMNTGVYVLARAGTELVGGTIGVAGGLFEMAGGIVTLAAHPIDTAKGLGSLVGLNPNVSAGEAWEGMGKALISYEDFKKGRIGVGVGRLFANIATTATGAGAAGAAGKAGVAAYAASRAAGAGVAKAMAKAGVAGSKAGAVYVGSTVKTGALKTAALPGKAVSLSGKAGQKIKSVATRIKGKEKAAVATTKNADEIGEAATAVARADDGLMSVERATTRAANEADIGIANTMPGEMPDEFVGKIRSYNQYKEIESSIKLENPGITDEALITEINSTYPGLFKSAQEFEETINSIKRTTPEMQTSIDLVNSRIQTTDGLIKTVDEVKNGDVPLTGQMVDQLLETKNGLKQLEDIIRNQGGNVHIESGIRAVDLTKKIEEARALHALRDSDVIAFDRINKSMPPDQMLQSIEQSLQRILRGDELPADDELAQILKRVSERDPEAFSIIENSRLEDLMSHHVIESVIYGRSVRVQTPDGTIRRIYTGSLAGRGGVGVATHVVYQTEGRVVRGAMKTPHDDPNAWVAFYDERMGANEVAVWNNPNIMKPIEVGNKYIIYETGNDVGNLVDAMIQLPTEEWLAVYRGAVNGTLEYWNRGFFHADIKGANIITYTTREMGEVKRVTKIIDNVPISFQRSSRVDWPRTEGYCFGKNEIGLAEREVARRTASTEEMNQWLGRAQDVRAHAKIMDGFLRYSIDPAMTPAPRAKLLYQQFTQLLEGAKDPVRAGEPGYLQDMVKTMEEISQELGMSGTRSTRNAPSPTAAPGQRVTLRETVPEATKRTAPENPKAARRTAPEVPKPTRTAGEGNNQKHTRMENP